MNARIFKNSNKPYREGRRAQAIVEFALIFPVVIMVMMGIFEFGFLLKNYLGMNYALGKAAEEASMCRGQMNAELKVIGKLLKSAFLIDTSCLQLITPTGNTIGPYRLDSSEVVCDMNWLPVTAFAERLFFYNDGGSPNDLTDDNTVDVSNPSLPSYAKITVIYTHTMICASILGLDGNRGYNGMSGTFVLKLSTQARLAPR